MTPEILESDADIARGVAWLARADPALAAAAAVTGPVALRRREAGFAALLSAIIGQQVSVASANAVWARLEAANLVEEHTIAAAEAEELRACGLSRQKIRYALALSQSRIPFDDLPHMDEPEVIKTLTAVPGIGLWTAEVYVMFALGRRDVFAAGDLALQEAVRVSHDLPERPSEKTLRAMAEAWSPWRTVAATLLWQYYACLKSREGIRP